MSLEDELRAVLNRNSAENSSGTPDFILADYLLSCLNAYNAAVNWREAWYGRDQNRFGMPVKGTPLLGPRLHHGETEEEQ